MYAGVTHRNSCPHVFFKSENYSLKGFNAIWLKFVFDPNNIIYISMETSR